MTNDLISNPNSKSDEICNYIISVSNDFANFIGCSYSELWIFIMIFTFVIISYYIILTACSLYLKHLFIIKCMFWSSIILLLFIGLVIFEKIIEYNLINKNLLI